MTNKLKNQANKLRGAVQKSKALKAFDGSDTSQDIVEERKAPAGYEKVLNDNRLISGDDENQLLDDNTLFQDLDKDDPLVNSSIQLKKCQKDLEEYL